MRTFLIVVLVLLLAPLAVAATIQLPKTGQVTSYSPGDDGALQRGVAWPSPRFTDNSNGTVTDNLTGLIWLKNANCFGAAAWADALTAANTLASGTCGLTDGSSTGDWRLPNKNELMSLITRNQTSTAAWLATSGLLNVQADGYWSSSSSGYFTSHAWFVLMQYGYVSYDPKSNSHYAWPVRGGQFGDPVVAVLPAARDFGSVPSGGSSSQVVTISNTAGAGSSKLQISSIALTGVDAGQFSINAGDGTGGTCGTLTPIISAGSSCTVAVSFNPTSAAAKSANLRVSSSDVNAPDIDLPLSGNGFSVSAAVSGGNGTVASANPVYVSSGATASFTLARAAGYLPSSDVTGSCPAGSFNGSTYTTGAITGNCSVGFTFVPGFFPLAIAVNGTGNGVVAVKPSPPGADCTGSCSQTFSVDTAVTLTSTAGTDSLFSGWSGCDSVSGNRCTVTMTGAKNVSAAFNYITYPLSLTYAGPAGGTVAMQPTPPGGSCSGSCSQPVRIGTTVTLTPADGSNARFVGWSGCDSVTDSQCTVTMTGAKNVTASFAYIEPAPAVTSHLPADGDKVPVSAAAQATFNEPLDAASITSGSFTLSGFAGAKAIAAGGYHTLALKKDGTVVAWGANWGGQSTVPAGLTGVVAVAAGYEHSVALKGDGTVVAWGVNDDHQTSVPAGLSGVVAIAAGSWHTVALKNDGTLVAWGRNYYGQSSVPGGLSGIVAIAAGSQQTVVLKKDGTVVAWGEMVFPPPAGLSEVTAIAAGRWHIAALKNDGTVVVWGESSWGQTRVPAGLSGVTAIAAGDYYTLALKSDGTAVAWGTGLSAPADVGLSAVSAGGSHGVGMKSDGTVVAWGSNTFGQVTVRPEFVGSGAAVSGVLAYDPATFTATFVPSAPLAANTLYTATLSGIRSAAGTPLAAPVSWSFTTAADLDPPVTAASVNCLHGSNGWCLSDAIVTLTATDAASGVAKTEYRIGAGLWTPYAAPFTVASNGTAAVSFRSTDVAGNREQDKVYSLAIDKSSPTTVASLAGIFGGNGRYISDVQVTLVAADSVSGVARTEYSLDGTTWNPYGAPFTISAEGTTVVSYRSLDNAGGVEPANTTTVTIDKTGVNSSITSPANGETIFTSSYTITGTASSGAGVQRVEVAIDGVWHTAIGTNPWSYSWTPTNGLHTIQSRATAISGAVEAAKQGITVTVAPNLPWLTRTAMPVPVSRAVSGVVNDKIYVLGGTKGSVTTDAVQIYNPADNSWQTQSPLCAPVFAAASATQGDIIYIAGGNGDSWGVKESIFAYNTATTSGSCSNAGYLAVPRFRMNGAILNNNLYVVGGIGGTGAILDSIEEFSLAAGNHASRLLTKPLPEARTLAAVVAAGDKLYIMGGSNSSGPTNTCWEYDPANTVQPFVVKSPMPVAVEARAAVQTNGKIYVVGGWTQSGITQAVQEYDIAKNSWNIVGYVPTARYATVAEAVSGSLYVMGGDNGKGGTLGVNEAAAIGGAWTVYSIGTGPPPYPQTPRYAIDWPATVHVQVSPGNYLKIGGAYYYVMGSGGLSGSWNGPSYNATALQQCNQATGAPLYDGTGNPLLADMSGSEGKGITLYAIWPLQTSWTVHSVGVPPLPYPQSPNYAIDWPAFQHPSLIAGSWLKIGGGYYYVLGSDPNYPGSWNGLDYNATALQQCNQATGAPLYDLAGNFLLADMSGTEGQSITLYGTWPLPLQTGPVSAITSPVNGAVLNSSSYTIIGTAAAGGGPSLQRVEVSTDCGATWSVATGTVQWSYAWTAPADGQYCIKSRAVNSAAGTENTGAGITVSVFDMPHSSIGSPASGTVLTGYTATITGTASSASGVQLVEVSTDGSNWFPATDTSGGSWGTWGYSWTLPANGQYTILSRATGSAGNVESPGVGVTVTVANAEQPTLGFSVSYGRNMPTARVGAVSAVVNGLIFVLGGSNQLDPPPAGSLTTVEMYNPVNDSWQSRTPLSVPRFAAGSAVAGDIVYIAGGTAVGGPSYGGPNQTNTVLSYNTTTGATSTVGYLNTARFRTDAALMNGRLYVFGGSGQTSAIGSVEEFDLSLKKVTSVDSMPAPRDLPAVVGYGGKIYVLGGFDENGAPTATCWEYDPSLHTFAVKSSMPVARGGRGAVVLGGKLYLLAGSVSPGPPPITMTPSLQEYDPATDRWQVVGSVPDLRWGFVAEYANNALYVIGGGNNQQLLGLNEIVTPVAAAPYTTVSPAAGVYNTARTVTLSANQPATTYYTTNGATPTTSSTRYTVPITISANTTLMFFSVGSAGSAETVKTAVYTIDTVPPTGSVSINNGAQLTSTTTVNLSLAANDASGVIQMQFSNDGVNWSLPEPYATAKLWSLAAGDGPKTVSVKFRDTVGNWSGAYSAAILLDGSSSFLPAVNYDTWSDARSLASGDFNGDGIPDIAVANNDAGTVSIMLGSVSGDFRPKVDYPAGSGPVSVIAGDFHGSGKLDLVVVNRNDNTLSLLPGNGDGTFGPKVDFQVGTAPYGVAAGDFNGDGKLDLVVANLGSNTISILRGNGDGTFMSKLDYPVNSPIAVVVGDFNHDGHLDVATANYGAGTVSVLIGNGDGTFLPKYDYAVGSNPDAITAADFDGDGKLDLATANYGSNTVSVLLGNGDGTFRPRSDYGTGSFPTSVATGDFNGDGKPDLAVTNYTGNSVSILLGNGDGTFQLKMDFPTGTGPAAVIMGDFNRDGKSDLAVVDSGGYWRSGQVSLLWSNIPIRIASMPVVRFDSFQAAYNSVTDGDTIQSHALAFTGDLVLDKAVAVSIKGGYDGTYSDNSMQTTINGAMKVLDGTVNVENLRFR